MTGPTTFAKAVALIEALIDKKFYGALTLKFEDGKVVHGEKRESIKFDGNNPRKAE